MSQHAIEQFFRRLSEDPALQREAEKTNALFSGTSPDDAEIFPAILALAQNTGSTLRRTNSSRSRSTLCAKAGKRRNKPSVPSQFRLVKQFAGIRRGQFVNGHQTQPERLFRGLKKE